jgi:hypothetical protein
MTVRCQRQNAQTSGKTLALENASGGKLAYGKMSPPVTEILLTTNDERTCADD